MKLRYNLPDDDKSRLIDYVVPASGLRAAHAPTGDFAFAATVAAFGQKLCGDPLLGDFDIADIERLATLADGIDGI